MALVPCGKDCYIDTDDLEQPEYYYYCKAKDLAEEARKRFGQTDSRDDLRHWNQCRFVAMDILTGKLTAEEAVEKCEWLRDDEEVGDAGSEINS